MTSKNVDRNEPFRRALADSCKAALKGDITTAMKEGPTIATVLGAIKAHEGSTQDSALGPNWVKFKEKFPELAVYILRCVAESRLDEKTALVPQVPEGYKVAKRFMIATTVNPGNQGGRNPGSQGSSKARKSRKQKFDDEDDDEKQSDAGPDDSVPKVSKSAKPGKPRAHQSASIGDKKNPESQSPKASLGNLNDIFNTGINDDMDPFPISPDRIGSIQTKIGHKRQMDFEEEADTQATSPFVPKKPKIEKQVETQDPGTEHHENDHTDNVGAPTDPSLAQSDYNGPNEEPILNLDYPSPPKADDEI